MKSDLIDLLACPVCQTAPLEIQVRSRRAEEIIEADLTCSRCGRSYPVRDGIPVMLPDLHNQETSHVDDLKAQEEMDEKLYEKHKEIREANIIYYDSVAEVYEDEVAIATILGDFNQSRIDKMVKGLAEKTQKNLFLDLGCGTGNVLKFGNKNFKRAIGIDISFNMLKVAKQNNLEVIQGDILYLPFKSSLFDVVSVFSVLHHLYDYSQMFDQISRVLKTGGYLYSDWDPPMKPSPDNGKVSWKVYQLVHALFSALRSVKRKIETIIKEDNPKEGPIDFLKMRPDLKEINVKAEFHEQKKGEERGIDFLTIKKQLEVLGFCDIQPFYHQSGLSIDQLTGVPLLKIKLLSLLGFDPQPFLENILILAKKEREFQENDLSISLAQCDRK